MPQLSSTGSPRVGPDFGKGPDHVGPAAAGISPSFMCDPTPDPIPQCGGAVKASHVSLTFLLELTKSSKACIAVMTEVETPPIRDLLEVFPDLENGLTFMKNVSIPLKASSLPIRANVYLPLSSDINAKYPVLVTYGPYGKDIPYETFHNGSFSEVNPEHRSKYSAWETPDPVYWCREGYAIVRADERGLGQSPGLLDTMSRGTSECFFDVVEWCAEQPWSTGKVGLLGISYYAGECPPDNEVHSHNLTTPRVAMAGGRSSS